jgi:hypothetical protein
MDNRSRFGTSIVFNFYTNARVSSAKIKFQYYGRTITFRSNTPQRHN